MGLITQQQIDEFNKVCEANKKKWPKGPWTNEPNRVEWEHSGFRCLALRQPNSGHWCGYVGLKPGHKYYGIPDSVSHYDEDGNEIENQPTCAYDLPFGHGGVTYGRFCEGNVCHISEGEKLFWLGFDCAHAYDFQPADHDWMNSESNIYRDIEYVKNRVNVMAEELKE